MTTTHLLIAALVAASLVAQAGRAAVQLVLTYLALRNTTPHQRINILHALRPALTALNGAPNTTTKSQHQGPRTRPRNPAAQHRFEQAQTNRTQITSPAHSEQCPRRYLE